MNKSPALCFAVAVAGAASVASAGIPMPEYVNEAGAGLNEAAFVNLQWPYAISLSVGQLTPSIYGRIWDPNLTAAPGPSPSIVAQIGFGPFGTNPFLDDSQWTWSSTSYNVQLGNDDEYVGSFVAPLVAGTYSYTYRFNINPGLAGIDAGWTLGDINGAGSNVGLAFEAEQMGVLTVVPAPGIATFGVVGLIAVARRRR